MQASLYIRLLTHSNQAPFISAHLLQLLHLALHLPQAGVARDVHVKKAFRQHQLLARLACSVHLALQGESIGENTVTRDVHVKKAFCQHQLLARLGRSVLLTLQGGRTGENTVTRDVHVKQALHQHQLLTRLALSRLARSVHLAPQGSMGESIAESGPLNASIFTSSHDKCQAA